MQQRFQANKYEELKKCGTKWKRLIDVDAPRTLPDVEVFDEEYRVSLRSVLYAYAVHNTEVGYCQGMNFIAGLLLLVSERSEEETFWVLLCMMENYRLSGFFQEGFPLFGRYLDAFAGLLEATLPDLGEHLARQNVQPGDFLHQWYLTLFVTCLPLPAVLVIWDAVLCSGGLALLLPIGMSILAALRHVLLAMPFEEIMSLLRATKLGIDEDGDAARVGQLLVRKGRKLSVPLHILELVAAQ